MTKNETNSLTIFTAAAKMLAEADTIQRAKELLDLAITAGEWAKRKGMGEQAIQHCRSYALDAERRMGELLYETERAKNRPGPGRGKAGSSALPALPDSPPTLKELGLTKSQAAKAKMLKNLPKEEFEKIRAGKLTKAKAKKNLKEAHDRAELAKAAAEIDAEKKRRLASVCDLHVCSCADLNIEQLRPAAVITDPPYPERFLPVFTELAIAAKSVPLVAVMVGQSYLPEVLHRLCQHLKYRWTIAYLTPGGQAVQQFEAKVNSFWKPVLIFGRAVSWVGDVAKSNVNANEKTHHEWGQSVSGMCDLIERLTDPGDLICDPFLGGGTTAIAALMLKRRFVGCDVDAIHVQETNMRVKAL